MKPRVTMHMMSSIDGRIVSDTWPKDFADHVSEVYEDIHAELKGDAWIVGRTTMAEFADGDPKPAKAVRTYPRTTWKAPDAGKGPYGIAVDQSGKLHLNKDRANGDPIIVVLTEAVADDHLEELRRDHISYIFAGADSLDLALALDTLAQDFAIKRLLLEGGGGINGSFLSAGLIDEISLILLPLADGTEGPTTFWRDKAPAPLLELLGVEQLDRGLLHLRYKLVSAS